MAAFLNTCWGISEIQVSFGSCPSCAVTISSNYYISSLVWNFRDRFLHFTGNRRLLLFTNLFILNINLYTVEIEQVHWFNQDFRIMTMFLSAYFLLVNF